MEGLGPAQEGEKSFTPAQGDADHTQRAHLDRETQGFVQKGSQLGNCGKVIFRVAHFHDKEQVLPLAENLL